MPESASKMILPDTSRLKSPVLVILGVSISVPTSRFLLIATFPVPAGLIVMSSLDLVPSIVLSLNLNASNSACPVTVNAPIVAEVALKAAFTSTASPKLMALESLLTICVPVSVT